MRNNPTGAMGLRDYLGTTGRRGSGSRSSTFPAVRSSPTTSPRRFCASPFTWSGSAPALELDDQGRPRRIFDRTVHEGCDRAGFAEHAQFSESLRRRPLPGEARVQWPGRQVQRADPRLGERRRWLPERRGHLHGLHDAGLSRQVHAVHGARCRRAHVRADRPIRARSAREVPARPSHSPQIRRRAGLAPPWRDPCERLPAVARRLSGAAQRAQRPAIAKWVNRASNPKRSRISDRTGSSSPGRRAVTAPHRSQ